MAQQTCPTCYGYGTDRSKLIASGIDNQGVPWAISEHCPTCKGRGTVASTATEREQQTAERAAETLPESLRVDIAARKAAADDVYADYVREQERLAARRYRVTLHYDAHPLLESRVVWEGQGFWVAAQWAQDAAKSLIAHYAYKYVESSADNTTYRAFLQDHSKQGLVYVLEGHATLEELPTVVPVLTPPEPIPEPISETTSERQERQEMNTLAVGDQVLRVSGATHGWGGSGVGVIERIIPGHMGQYPASWVDAKAVVEWPAPRRIGGRGAMRTTVALKSLARPDEMGACDQCGRHRRLMDAGTRRICGTCIHREERRINTHEMYHHGRRGY